MKLAVITDEVTQDFEEAIRWMRRENVPAAELRSMWDVNISKIDDETKSRALNALRAENIQVCSIASPVYKCALEDTEAKEGATHLAADSGFQDQLPLLARCLEIADVFQAPFVRIFSFWRLHEPTPEHEEKLINALGEAARLAEKAGKTLLLENEHACMLATAEETVPVLKRVDSPYLKAVWDPGNAFCAGENPYPEGYELIAPYVAHVHIKDAAMTQEGCRFTIVGEGQIDYAGQFRALREAGYQGYLSLETHAAVPGLTAAQTSGRCLSAMRRLMGEEDQCR